jgi:hypothetical protein
MAALSIALSLIVQYCGGRFAFGEVNADEQSSGRRPGSRPEDADREVVGRWTGSGDRRSRTHRDATA